MLVELRVSALEIILSIGSPSESGVDVKPEEFHVGGPRQKNSYDVKLRGRLLSTEKSITALLERSP